ncbi:MAG: adenosylhomocysteinase [Nanoarchaeota archaeon]|nr:adenosylhomocysteinase [Nanoarchaeota archaeon]MBU4299912.1 adenosylhomocysteinase [Nanoarchaeota archaeon]MBU4452217.1 adenosylhomocysteinase [Nanoarchaeota archaeon]
MKIQEISKPSKPSFEVKDISLAEQGKKQIEWAEVQMVGLMKIRARFKKEKPLAGVKIGMALHVTKETAVLVRTLLDGGAEVAITGCNPLSTQDDVAAALAKDGVNVYAKRGVNKEDYYRFIHTIMDFEPNITIDDGCDLVSEIHTKRPELIKNIIAGAEETTTGVIRLHAMVRDGALKYPMIAVNDSNTKHLVDNYYGTGQSTLDGIIRATNVFIGGKNFVVAGYGPCGKGVALKACGMGAHVIVTEVDAFRALQAHFDGYRVMPMAEAAKIGDIFVTLTGDKNVIDIHHMKAMKTGAILANSGHFDAEINLKELSKIAQKRNIRANMDEYSFDGKKIFILGEGRLVNLAAAEGHPSLVMSFSFCDQALACEYAVKNKGKLNIAVHKLPDEVDDNVAKIHLEAMGIHFDVLTEEQKKYLASWEEGT